MENLWQFACGLYEVDSIKTACLDLQEKYGANVNLILWFAWMDATHQHLNRSSLDDAQNIVRGDNHCNQLLLNSLRQAREFLADDCNFTRVQAQLIHKHILAAELAVEKVLMQRLQDFTSRSPRAENGVEVLSLFDYFALINMPNPAQRAARLLEKSRSWFAVVTESAAIH